MNAIQIVGPSEPIPVPQQSGDPMFAVIERMMRDPSVDLDRLERAMNLAEGMRERGESNAAESAFNAAMSAVQAKMVRVAADAKNDQTRSRYATYAALDRAIKPLYVDAGFNLSFNEEDSPQPDHVRVVCYVSHTAPGATRSHTRTYRCDMPADGKGARGNDVMTKTHAHGSAHTYARRYLLMMIFNIAIGDDPTDDDGNAAGNRATTSKISQAQLVQLISLAEDAGADKIAFCKYFKIASFADMTAGEQFDRAIAALNKKKASRQ